MTALKAATHLVHAARPSEPGAPLNTPLVPSSTYLAGGGRTYSREDSTVTWDALEEIMGGLEGGKAVTFSSGMAAAAAVFEQLPGDARVALPDDVYHGVAKVAHAGEKLGRWRVERIATDDTAAWVKAAESHHLLWIETPSNPLLILADLPAICAAPRRAGGLVAVDNTFATPLNQRPLQVGADISMHSATKYIGGHSDLLAGILVASEPALVEGFKRARMLGGATPGALEAWLAVRGLRTLAVRLERAQSNAQRLAEFLAGHPVVENVRYPGLPSDPGHAMACAQLDGFGAVISFELRGGAAMADALCQATRVVHHCTSLGGVESTMERRATHEGQEHLPPSLLRISVGIEDVDDLLADLDQALTAASA